MSGELPEGWAEATVGDVITGFEAGRNLRAKGGPASPGEYGVLKISAVTWGSFRPEENKGLLPGDAPKPHELVRKGDLLITRANTSDLVGAVVVVDRDHPELMLPDKILRMQTRAAVIERRYLLQALRTQPVREHFERNATGTSESMRNLSQPKMAAAPILLAPLPEQRRIVDAVEALLEQVGQARERLDRVPLILKRLRQAVLAAACSGRLTEEWREGAQQSAWESVTVEGVCRSVTDGDHQAPPKAASGVPFITIAAINDGELRLDKATRHVPASYFASLKPERRPAPGDVLFSVTGSIGISALVKNPEPFVFQRHIAILKPNADRILSKFLRYRMEAHDIKVQGEETATGTAQLTIPLGGLRTFTFELPSLTEQAEIVRQVEKLFALADTIERRLQAASASANQLPQAILSKAFSGELVPTEADLARADGRTYETAAELLARVAGETESEGVDQGKDRRPAKSRRAPRRRTG